MDNSEELSFETLLKLRDEVGLKTYQQFEAEKYYNKNETEQALNRKRKMKESKTNSDDDEAPVEISSKRPFKKNKPSQKWRIEAPRNINPRFLNREVNKKQNQPKNNKNVEILNDGTKFYKTKKVQRTEELVNKFIELKKNGQLEKHLDKRRKKIAGKERKKMNIEK
ncbi:hypothetical protein PVAND_001342 [Polypedilum vanderplanki]|uniref:rRNA biogenesis protein RRP36 n=1 Tax=Polypedilum vanderplanki TaxID=319348 RepID=A0A9J6BN31_POLVA|nr:hypothetical protein PVAND_001342 [Polypedilum vanderplanki]